MENEKVESQSFNKSHFFFNFIILEGVTNTRFYFPRTTMAN